MALYFLVFMSSILFRGVSMQCTADGDPCNPPYPCVTDLEMSDPDNCYGMQICVAPYEWVSSEVECGENKGPYDNETCTCGSQFNCSTFECPPPPITPGPPIESEPCFVEPTACADEPFYIPDRFYCTKYFTCQQGTFVSQTCTGDNAYFNVEVFFPNIPCTNNIVRCNLIPFGECADFTTTVPTTTQPTTTEKTTTQPTTTELTTTQPTTTQKTTTQPTTTEPTTTVPTTTVPTTNVPTTTDPTTTDPTTTVPTTTDQTTTLPTTTDLTTSVTTTTDPTTTVLTTTDPTTTVPTTTDPTTTVPTTTDPTTIEPLTTDPTTPVPITIDLTTTDPTSTEPTTTEPTTIQSTTTEPLTSEPISTEPLITEPATAELSSTSFEDLTTELTHIKESTTELTPPLTSERLTSRPITSKLPTFEPSTRTTKTSTLTEWISSSTVKASTVDETRQPSTTIPTHLPGTGSSPGTTQTLPTSRTTPASTSTTTSPQSTASTTTDPASPDACIPLGGCYTGEKVTHISDCSLYFECFDGQWQLQDCNDVDPNNPLYNPDKEKCMKKPMVDCTRRCNTGGIRMNKMNRNIVIITIICTAGLLAIILILVLCCCNQSEEGSYSAKNLISKKTHGNSVTNIPLSVDGSMEMHNTDYLYHVSPPLGPIEDFSDVMLLEYRSKLAAGQDGIDVTIPADGLQEQDMAIDISGDRAALYRPTDIDAVDKNVLDPSTPTRDPLYLDSMSSGPRPSKFGVMDI